MEKQIAKIKNKKDKSMMHNFTSINLLTNRSIYKQCKQLLFIVFSFYFLLFTFYSYSFAQSSPPTSGNYKLLEYGFGSGGTASSSSTNYSLFGNLGQVDQGSPSSANYFIGAGLEFTLQASVSASPTLTNPDNWYNKLHLVINRGGNDPADTEYAVRIASGSGTFQYIQTDMTVGNSLGEEDWLTYTNWGAGSGVNLIGLSPGTLYTVQVTARQGRFFTQFMWSPQATASTVNSMLSFDIDVASTDTETGAPYNLSIGDLASGSVITAPNKVWIDFSTNANGGGFLSINGTNGGLQSTTVAHTITSSTADLTAQPDGYGARSSTVSESAGGPMRSLTPYNGSSDNVGVLDTLKRYIYDSSESPVTGGRVSFELKAKASNTTPSAPDYVDVLTVIASGSF